MIKSEMVTCGKPNCSKLHGSYLYRYFYENGKLKKKYIGKGTINDYNKALEYQKHLKLKIDLKEILKIISLDWLSKARIIAKSKGLRCNSDIDAMVCITQEKYLDYNNERVLDDFLNQQVLTISQKP